MGQVKGFVVHESVYHDVLAYLGTRPFTEVSILISAMRDSESSYFDDGCGGDDGAVEERVPAIGFDCSGCGDDDDLEPDDGDICDIAGGGGGM